MKRTIAILIAAAALLTSASAHAWFDRLTHDRQGLFFPMRYELMHLGYSYNHDASFTAAPTDEVAYHTIDFGALIPIPITDNFAFSTGVNFNMHHFRLKNVTNYYVGSSHNAYLINIPMHGTFFLGENWMLDLAFLPTISSDLKGFSSHDMQWVGGVIAGWIFSDSASLLFGVYASKEFWEYYPIPLLGFIVRPPGSFFDAEIVLPQYMRFNFEVASFVKLFVQGEFEGYVWDLNDEASSGVPDHFLKMIDTQAGAGAKFRIVPGFYIEAWGGVNPYRKYDFADRNNQQFRSRQKVGWFVETNISFGPELFGLGGKP